MLIDFRQFLYDSVEKVLFKTDFFFFFFFCMKEMRRQTLAHNLNTQCISYAHVHNAMHNNLHVLEMKRVLELQPFIPNANRLNI